MKEAIGTSYVFNLIMIFTAVFIALLIGSIAYSKGFKVRNRIIDIVEKHKGYTDQAVTEIDENLSMIGYRVAERSCHDRDNATAITGKSDYRYCIYEYQTDKGPYYGVTVFIHFDIPLLGDWMEIPLYGETRIIFDKGTVEG